MKWQTASFGIGTREVDSKYREGSLEWALCKQSFLDNGGRKAPILLFVYSNEVKKPASKKSKPRPTTQAIKSGKVQATVFDDDSFKMQICSRFFSCYRMDVTSVSEKESKGLCSKKAPVVAVFTHDGKLIGTSECSLSSAFRDMSNAAKIYGVDLPRAYSDALGQVRALYTNEVKLHRLKDDLKKAQADARPSGKGKKVPEVRLKKVEKAKKLVAECQELSKQIKEKYVEILVKHTKKDERASLK